jgi:hypothetical protein
MPAWTLKQTKSWENIWFAKNRSSAVLPTPDYPIIIIGRWHITLWIIKHILKKLSRVILYEFNYG